MTNVKQEIELQVSAQQWVDNIMKNFNISATDMTNALSKVLVNLKDKSMLEYIAEITRQEQEYAAAQQEAMQSQAPLEEEGYDD